MASYVTSPMEWISAGLVTSTSAKGRLLSEAARGAPRNCEVETVHYDKSAHWMTRVLLALSVNCVVLAEEANHGHLSHAL